MTADDQLDSVLRYLDNEEEYPELHSEIKSKLSFSISEKDLELLLDKLYIDGHVSFKTGKTGGQPNDIRNYFITFQGRQFLNHSFLCKNRPYKAHATLAKINNAWTIIKTIVVVIHAVIILFIAAIGVWVTYDSRQKDTEIKSLNLQLDKQASTIDTLLHYKTTTKLSSTNKK